MTILSQAITKIPQDFTCPITSDIFIDPIKTDCPTSETGHIFEKLALANWFRQKQSCTCPLCRHSVNTVLPDEALARRILNEFIRFNHKNDRYFNSVKKDLERNFRHLINQSVIPQPKINSRVPRQRVPRQRVRRQRVNQLSFRSSDYSYFSSSDEYERHLKSLLEGPFF